MIALRFDDILETVLAGENETPAARQATWRQLVDLIGRRRVAPTERAILLLRQIRADIPLPVRATSARMLEMADPPAPLVALFACDQLPVALPVLRSARISSQEWLALLPKLNPAARSVLRNRRDLGPAVVRALESYGSVDFVLPDGRVPEVEDGVPMEDVADTSLIDADPAVANAPLLDDMSAPPAVQAINWIEVLEIGGGVIDIDPKLGSQPAKLIDTEGPEPDNMATMDADEAIDTDTQADPDDAPVEAEQRPAFARFGAVSPPSSPFVSLGAVAFGLPVVAAAMKQKDEQVGRPTSSSIDDNVQNTPPAEHAPADEEVAATGAETVADALRTTAETADSDVTHDPTTADPAIEPVDEPVVADALISEAALSNESSAAAIEAPPLTTEAVAGTATSSSQLPVAQESPSDVDAAEDATDAPAASATGVDLIAAPEAPPVIPTPEADSASPEAVSDAASNSDAPVDAPVAADTPAERDGMFRISEVVARIDAFQKQQEAAVEQGAQPQLADVQSFRFETDASGTVHWVDGVVRGPLIGLSLAIAGGDGASRVDGSVAGAFRQRQRFSDARLLVEGESDAAGSWRISGVPAFEAASGRFIGYRGTARRPRADEQAATVAERPGQRAAQALRQLVHELRTPAGAISGFAEMIESQMLGPVPAGYRDRAADIRQEAKRLLGVIEDLDFAARIEDSALDLRAQSVAIRPILIRIIGDLMPLAHSRNASLALPISDSRVTADVHAIERLLTRLLTTLVAMLREKERLGIQIEGAGAAVVAIRMDRPAALSDAPTGDDGEDGGPALLGTDFSLRLVRNLAEQLGGSLIIAGDSLTLHLPAAEEGEMDQAQPR